jgi:hypothetical protein
MRVFLTVVSWLLAVACVVAANAVGCARSVVSVSRAPTEGPVILRGRIAGSARAPAPSGALGAAWAAWMAESSPHGFPRPLCGELDADQLWLEDGTARIRIASSFFSFGQSRGLIVGPLIHVSPAPAVPAQPPAAFADRCGRAATDGSGRYKEVVLPVGASVEVSGCRDRDRVAPCDDGADMITTSEMPPLTSGAARRHDRGWMRQAIAVITVATLVALVWGSRRPPKEA